FKIPRADRFAPEIKKAGPLLFQDLLGKSRDIFVQHTGTDAKAGWSAFLAHPEGEARTCQLVWRQKTHDFRDPCSRQVYPADGAGLPHYKVTVADNGDLTVDLNAPAAGP
ncbi:MAG: hypothetical protein JO054_03830, partial [Actinobacteria bacterium]|nr:hypothetical protein [Actinomycetota bacterium]